MKYGATLFVIFVGLALSNFLYAAFTGASFETALERSFFQGVAISIVGIALWVHP